MDIIKLKKTVGSAVIFSELLEKAIEDGSHEAIDTAFFNLKRELNSLQKMTDQDKNGSRRPVRHSGLTVSVETASIGQSSR